jgi:DNA-binding FadR family transcriptional regulator
MTGMFQYAYPNLEGRNEAMDWHRRILDAIRNRNPALARDAMTRHLERSEINITHMQQDISLLCRPDGPAG